MAQVVRTERIKDPSSPGEILVKARLVDEDSGEVIAGLGGMTFDEDEFAAQGLDAMNASIETWAAERLAAYRAKRGG